MKKKTCISVALITAAVSGVILVSFQPNSSESPEKIRTRPGSRSKMDASMALLTQQASGTPNSLARAIEENVKTGDIRPGSSPLFRRFMVLKQVALPGAEQRRELEALLADEGLIEECTAVLVARTEYIESEHGNQARMAAIDHLGRALLWKENPARELAKRGALRIIQRNLDQLERPRSLKRYLAGDQVELYQYLLRSDRDEAIKIFEREWRTPPGTLMAYAIKFESEQLASRR